MDDLHDNLVTLLCMTVPLPGTEDEAKRRWVEALEALEVPSARKMVLRQMALWPQALEVIRRGHTVETLARALEEQEQETPDDAG